MTERRPISRMPWREAVRAAHAERTCPVLDGPAGRVADEVQLALTPLARVRGLLGRAALDPGAALLISPCRQVHTIGMRFPIDAVFCDAGLNVLHVRTLEPGRISRAVRGARCCIELPAGAAERHGLVPGVALRFGRR